MTTKKAAVVKEEVKAEVEAPTSEVVEQAQAAADQVEVLAKEADPEPEADVGIPKDDVKDTSEEGEVLVSDLQVHFDRCEANREILIDEIKALHDKDSEEHALLSAELSYLNAYLERLGDRLSRIA